MSSKIVEVDSKNFEDVVLRSEKPVLLDFSAPWCGPCKMVEPILNELAGSRDDIVIAKVNIDDNIELSATYGVRSVPTMIVFINGQPQSAKVGALPKGAIEHFIAQCLM